MKTLIFLLIVATGYVGCQSSAGVFASSSILPSSSAISDSSVTVTSSSVNLNQSSAIISSSSVEVNPSSSSVASSVQASISPSPSSSIALSSSAVSAVDGVWSAWENTGECVNGKQNQTRTCTPPSGGGQPCSGVSSQLINCTTSVAARIILPSFCFHIFFLVFVKLIFY